MKNLVASAVARMPSSIRSTYASKLADVRASAAKSAELVTEEDLAPLPAPVQAYLRFVGVVGKPRVLRVHAHFRGDFRRSPTASWLPVTAEQFNGFAPRTRVFTIEASVLGVPFDALHVYESGVATMRAQVGGFLNVVDARGPEMNQSETVTFFNDMCMLAPATLIDPSIRWETLAKNVVRATFTEQGNVISAELTFDEEGRLTCFVSDDRYLSADGTTYEKLRWTTPFRDYKDFGGMRLASHGEAVWRLATGDYVYARLDVVHVTYDLSAAR